MKLRFLSWYIAALAAYATICLGLEYAIFGAFESRPWDALVCFGVSFAASLTARHVTKEG